MSNERIPTMPQGEERIPTMPQGEERIPTMPQGEERIPTMPQGEERVPTMPQGDGRIATVPQGDGRVATVPQGGAPAGGATGRILLSGNMEFMGQSGAIYTIEGGNVISADSGESQIYGCSKGGNPQKLVARVLISVTPESPEEKIAARNRVIRFLSTVSKKENSHILPLEDYGSIRINGKEYYVEIYPFCEGGDLGLQKGAISYESLCKEIIPAINEALHTFHDCGFVHRDVKPDNLYRYDGRVVIGDFGITCDLRSDGFATDRTKTGTLGYYAPELMSQAALKASDYYSFGQTIWTLYSGEMMYQNILRRYRDAGIEEQRNQINFSMLNGIYYGLDEIRPEESFFEILIRGLLQYDPASRFDYALVNRWLSGDKSVAHEIMKFDSKSIYKTPFRYNGKDYWDHLEVSEVLQQNWESAKELLYSGQLKDFYMYQDYAMGEEINRIMKEYSRSSGSTSTDTRNDIGLARLLLKLNGGTKLPWRGTVYNRMEGLSDHLIMRFKASEQYEIYGDISELLCSELVGYWYQLQQTAKGESVDETIVDIISTIRAFASDDLRFKNYTAYCIARYIFAADPAKEQFLDCFDIEDLAREVGSQVDPCHYIADALVHNPMFYGFLFKCGLGSSATHLIENFNGDYAAIESVFDLLEKNCKDEDNLYELVAKYRKCGPDAYMDWFRKHIDLYQFNGEKAEALHKEIEDFNLGGKTIGEIRENNRAFSKLLVRFRSMFLDNIYLARMGITDGKEEDGILSCHSDAYWHKKYLGNDVPIGYTNDPVVDLSKIKIGGGSK